jgi:hypothetical protein
MKEEKCREDDTECKKRLEEEEEDDDYGMPIWMLAGIADGIGGGIPP